MSNCVKYLYGTVNYIVNLVIQVLLSSYYSPEREEN